MIPIDRVGFVVLMPSESGRVVESLPMVNALRQQVEHSELLIMAEPDHQWIIEAAGIGDGFLPVSKPLYRMIDQVHDHMPDWLIDLRGGLTTWRFKNRLKVMDLTIRKRRGINWSNELFRLLGVFDVEAGRPSDGLIPPFFDRKKLPESFGKGYLTLFLDSDDFPQKPHESQINNLLSMTDRYVVLCGSSAMRPLADSIGSQTGCTTFVSAGDFSLVEMVSLMNDSAGVITFDTVWKSWAAVLEKPLMTIAYNSNGIWTNPAEKLSAEILKWRIS